LSSASTAGGITVPDDMRLTIWRTAGDFTILPAAAVLAVPTEIRGRYDGSGLWLPPESGPLIRFSFSWLAIPGTAFLATLAVAERLASHLADMAGDWPSRIAHTVLLPVVDTSYEFEVTPEARQRVPVPSASETLGAALGALGMGWLGAFAEQGFEDAAAVVRLAQDGEAPR
jgi:hypothetical protein